MKKTLNEEKQRIRQMMKLTEQFDEPQDLNIEDPDEDDGKGYPSTDDYGNKIYSGEALKDAHIVKTVNITPKPEPGPEGEEDDDYHMYTPRVEKVWLIASGEISQHDMAYTIFGEAKYVNILQIQKIAPDTFLHIVQVTYRSPEEREDYERYGDMDEQGETSIDEYSHQYNKNMTQGFALNEGNAFIGAAIKAKNEGKETFQHNGKTYRVTIKK